jgi:hypothetical protein
MKVPKDHPTNYKRSFFPYPEKQLKVTAILLISKNGKEKRLIDLKEVKND